MDDCDTNSLLLWCLRAHGTNYFWPLTLSPLSLPVAPSESWYLIAWSETNIFDGFPFLKYFFFVPVLYVSFSNQILSGVASWRPALTCVLLPGAMPKGDTWPGGVAVEPLSNMDSAGSCDSVISTNSGYVSSDALTSIFYWHCCFTLGGPYNTKYWHILTSTVGCGSLLDTQVEMWWHFKKTFLKDTYLMLVLSLSSSPKAGRVKK